MPRPESSGPETCPAPTSTGPGWLQRALAAWPRCAPALAGFRAGLPAPPWPRRCLVCGEGCTAQGVELRQAAIDLCTACWSGLPWLRASCACCARPLPEPALACGRCLRRPPPQTFTRAAFLYDTPLDRLLPRLKFHQDLAAGRSLALAMAEAFADAPRPDALVPLPLHRSRLRSRGFDQTLELARLLARQLDLPLRADLLRRRRATAPQSRLNAAARRRNLRDAFLVPPPRRMSAMPAHVVLFDDVMTTGATVQSAATALLRAGVRRVDVWVCARVP